MNLCCSGLQGHFGSHLKSDSTEKFLKDIRELTFPVQWYPASSTVPPGDHRLFCSNSRDTATTTSPHNTVRAHTLKKVLTSRRLLLTQSVDTYTKTHSVLLCRAITLYCSLMGTKVWSIFDQNHLWATWKYRLNKTKSTDSAIWNCEELIRYISVALNPGVGWVWYVLDVNVGLAWMNLNKSY